MRSALRELSPQEIQEVAGAQSAIDIGGPHPDPMPPVPNPGGGGGRPREPLDSLP